ncbi:MAG: pyrroline-5-carboxylate reductase [Clostridia bacterium]|nr:pyrroline-5-carboxylate reductase [Clostridia bacterium]
MKIGFIGAGNMATAIIGGLVRSDFEKKDIFVYDVFAEKLQAFAEMGLSVSDSASDLTKESDIIVLAVKPQQYGEVIEGIAENATMDKTFVSIAAGITVEYVRRKLGLDAPVVRVMPNTPLLLGKGATALSPSENVSEEAFTIVKGMFECSGVVEILPENLMNAVISVNGSSPAYIYLFAKAVCDSAEAQGIDREVAMKLFAAVLEGSAEMLRSSGDDPDTLIAKVSSKGGTTIAALERLYAHDFVNSIDDAMKACTKRAEELAAEA